MTREENIYKIVKERRAEFRKKMHALIEDTDSKSTVIDFGCGVGDFLEELIEAGRHCIGVDVQLSKVEYCISKGLPVIRMDLNNIERNGLLKYKYDYGVALDVVEHLADPRIFFMRARQVCDQLILCVSTGPESCNDEYERHLTRYNMDQFREDLDQTGWHIKNDFVEEYRPVNPEQPPAFICVCINKEIIK